MNINEFLKEYSENRIDEERKAQYFTKRSLEEHLAVELANGVFNFIASLIVDSNNKKA